MLSGMRASPTQPFREAIEDGRTGLLAATPADWADALERLVTDPDLRERIGARARRAALLRWSPPRQGRTYRALLLAASEHRRVSGARLSTWEPVVDDEPSSPVPVRLEVHPSDGQPAHRAWNRHLSAARRVFATEGPRGVATRILARAARR